jgi:DeoR/GlpR family transcriptional regulator of sugar metabolism
MRCQGTIRQWRLLRMAYSSRYLSIPKAASELKVSEKTIRRDFTALESAGFPLYRVHHEGYPVFFRLQKDWFLGG